MSKDLIEEILDEMTISHGLTEREVLVAKLAMQSLAFVLRFGKKINEE